PARAPPCPYTTLFRSHRVQLCRLRQEPLALALGAVEGLQMRRADSHTRKAVLPREGVRDAPRRGGRVVPEVIPRLIGHGVEQPRSEEHTSELQSRFDL